MSAETKPNTPVTDEQGEAAYHRYVPGARLGWEHLTMEERLAWRNVARAAPPQQKASEPDQPKVKSLGQICYEAAWEGQPERSWAPRDAEYWEKAAQAVAVAVLHMRYDEMTPELKAAADEGIWSRARLAPLAEQPPSVHLLNPTQPQSAVGIVPHLGYRWKVTGSGEEWIAEEVKVD